VSLVSRYLEENGIPTVVMAAARDIVEHCGVARMLHLDFPLGSPCGEPFNITQQTEALEMAFCILETADAPRTTTEAPFVWSDGQEWKELVFTEARPWKSGEDEQDWLRKKELYKSLKAEGKV
tara:strand:+ start:530 stop:898 length:369 start_codon:yes stop_codon:yes gene_type:complete